MRKSYIAVIVSFIIVCCFGIVNADINDGLVAYYPFNGNANDESGNGNNGVVYGAILTTDRVGNAYSAYSFNGSTDYIDLGDSSALNPELLTISAWFNASSSTSDIRCIVSRNPDNWSDYGYNVDTRNDNIAAGHGKSDGSPVIISDGAAISLFEKWHHVVLVYDGIMLTLYFNGSITGTQKSIDSLNRNTASTLIGKFRISDSRGQYHFHGAIDDVRIYDRALTESEILELYGITLNSGPMAIAGTSLDGNTALQLDGTLSSDPDSDPLTFNWQIAGETSPRTGQIVSVSDLSIGTYTVDLTVSDGSLSSTDTMLFGVAGESGTVTSTPDALQQSVNAIKDLIAGFPEASFDAPNSMARENRRKALLNMLDKVYDSIGMLDDQAAIDQLRDVLTKSDGLEPPESAPDWILGTDGQLVDQTATDLINDLLIVCSSCN